jgi:NOL1/NOP2/fmu family ribosome biogenesis protein
VVAWFLKHFPAFELKRMTLPQVDGSLPGSTVEGCLRIWPHHTPALGQFAAVLVNTAANGLTRLIGKSPGHPLAGNEFDELAAWLGSERTEQVRCFNDNYFLPPPELPSDLGDLRLARIGVAVANRVGHTLRPHHAAATAAALQPHWSRIPVDDDDARRWLQGHEITVDRSPGWHVPTWHDLPLGWGKASSARLKNHLPKFRRS